jgi:predicted RNase H-like HicB family nuclease
MKTESINIESQVKYYSNLPYSIVIDKWDDGNGPYYVAKVLELPGCLIHGDTPEEAINEIKDVMRDWIRTSLELGHKIPKPRRRENHSGKVVLRMPPFLHETLIQRAEIEGVSLNQYMVTALSRSAGYGEGWEARQKQRKPKTSTIATKTSAGTR